MSIPINYLAVLVAGVASMIIGALWYGPIFGKMWITLMGFTDERMKAAKEKGMAKTYAINFVGALVMAYVLAHALVFASAYFKASGASAGLQAGFWNWLGFVAPVMLGSVLWEGKSVKLYSLNVAYYLVNLCAMGVILAVWQ